MFNTAEKAQKGPRHPHSTGILSAVLQTQDREKFVVGKVPHYAPFLRRPLSWLPLPLRGREQRCCHQILLRNALQSVDVWFL